MQSFLKSVIVISLSFISSTCSKNQDQMNEQPYVNPVVFPGVKEYYRKFSWQKNAVNDYEMTIDTWKLTDSVINRGVKVYVAIFTDWSPFERVPQTLHDASLPDTVNLSYTLTVGQLKIFAKAPFEITWPSDAMIEYQ